MVEKAHIYSWFLKICHGNSQRVLKINQTFYRPYVPSVLWRCWLGGRKGIRPVKKYGVMRCWHDCLSGVRCKWFAYGSADATATPSSLASAKSRMVYPSGTGLPRLSWKKAVKRLCVCVFCVVKEQNFFGDDAAFYRNSSRRALIH